MEETLVFAQACHTSPTVKQFTENLVQPGDPRSDDGGDSQKYA